MTAVCRELIRLGVKVDEYPDGLTINPCHSFHPAEINTYNDHRMAMAFSLIGLKIPGITILDPDCVSKTFPNFYKYWNNCDHDPPLTFITHWVLPDTRWSQSLAGIACGCAKASGLQGEYRLYPIPSLPDGLEALQKLIVSLRNGDLDGLNVTIPHKQAVIPFLDDLTPLAQKIGAVNTVFRRDGRLVGDNTDAPGFRKDLSRNFKGFNIPLTALVLGAGGSARTVVHTLLGIGWHVIIAAREDRKGRAIVNGSDFNDEHYEVIGLGSLRNLFKNLKISNLRRPKSHPSAAAGP